MLLTAAPRCPAPFRRPDARCWRWRRRTAALEEVFLALTEGESDQNDEEEEGKAE